MIYDFSQFLLILPTLAAVVSFGVGILVFSRNPRHPANIGFGLGMLSLTLIEGGDAMLLLSGSETWFLLGRYLSLTGKALLPSTWFLFSLTFARANYKELLSRWRPLLIALYLGSAFFISWIRSPLFTYQSYSDEIHWALLLGPVGRYFYIFLLLGMLLNLIHIENTLRFSTGFKRRQSKYIIVGVGAVLAFHIYLASQALLFSMLTLSHIPITSVVVLISTGLIMLTVVKNKLLDVDIFISRYIIYNSLSVLIVGAYLLTVGLVAQGIKLYGGAFDTFWSPLFVFVTMVALVVVVLSARLRRKAQLFINRHFYRHKYEFRDKWMETIEKIGAKGDLSQVQGALVEMISETMAVKEIYLWLYEPVSCEYHLVTSTVSAAGPIRFKEDHPVISYIKKYNMPFLINSEIQKDKGRERDRACPDPELDSGVSGVRGSQGFPDEIAPLIAATKAVLCTPLIAGGGDLIGFILQGEDISGEPYRKDDLDLLKAIAGHAANRIKTIRLTQELLAARETEAFHQVSSFFIHDLKNLVSTLSLLSGNAEEHISNPLFQKDTLRTLKGTVAKMNAMISNMTLLSKGLRINPAPLDINGIVDETLSTLNGQVSTRIVKNLERLPSVSGDGEQLHKVFLNLLLNAIEATPSNKGIGIQTCTNSGEVILTVSDQGCGMSKEFIRTSLFKPFRSSKSHGLGIGLFQCKKIVEAHGGRIEVESEEGMGSEFRVVLPL
ncbi:MAG: GHKL domain-containing protein [Nitrospirae bacterium]|nr:GHKL domain-containing protein [Nitrospirota bacterium]